MPTPTFPTTHLLSATCATVAAASPHYVGSITLSPALCDLAHLAPRQQVQIRVERTSLELWTYVIAADETAPSTLVCINGAAALHVSPDDIVIISAYARCARPPDACPALYDAVAAVPPAPARPPLLAEDVLVELAVAKIHRPRVTAVAPLSNSLPVPCVAIDSEWMRALGLVEAQQVHVVNVTNGRRDVLVVHAAPGGSRTCELCMFAGSVVTGLDRSGFDLRYAVGDVIIIMAYCVVSTACLFGAGALPKMRVCFPCEVPEKERESLALERALLGRDS